MNIILISNSFIACALLVNGILLGDGAPISLDAIPNVFQKLVLGYDAVQDQLLKHVRYDDQQIEKIANKEQVTIEDIKTMNNAGVTDDKIISLIKSTGSVYHLTSTDVYRTCFNNWPEAA